MIKGLKFLLYKHESTKSAVLPIIFKLQITDGIKNSISTQWLLSDVGEWLNFALTLTLSIIDLRETIISKFSDHNNKRIVNITNCII